jgi:hypothetical protein
LKRDILRRKIHGIHIWQLRRLKWLEVLSRRSWRVTRQHAFTKARARGSEPGPQRRNTGTDRNCAR